MYRFIRGCSQPIRLEIKKAYSDLKGRGKSLELLEVILRVETEDRFAVKISSLFHKNDRFKRRQLASISGCGERGRGEVYAPQKGILLTKARSS